MNEFKYIRLLFIGLLLSGCDSYKILALSPTEVASEQVINGLHCEGLWRNKASIFIEIESDNPFSNDFELLPQKTMIQVNTESPAYITDWADLDSKHISPNRREIVIKRLEKYRNVWQDTETSNVYIILFFGKEGEELPVKFLVR
ncbi:MAG: hypothetical protein JXR40_02080 [Pontiellaceae bacterium]|nr:hypothetical protein [Pontiellaceae bacterium]